MKNTKALSSVGSVPKHLFGAWSKSRNSRRDWKLLNLRKASVTTCRTTYAHTISWTPLADDWNRFVWTRKVELAASSGLFFTLHRGSCYAKTMKSHEVIIALKAIFARHGIPEVWSDNDRQYTSAEFTSFAKEWGFRHITSRPCFPQSNGEVKRAVETVKSFLKKEKHPSKVLLAYRSANLACGYSPSELLMGRKLRTTIPTLHSNLYSCWPDMNVLRERSKEQRETKAQLQSASERYATERITSWYSRAHEGVMICWHCKQNSRNT